MTELVRSESLRGYCQLVRSLNGDPQALLAKQGLNHQLIDQDGAMFSYRSFVNLLEDTAQQLKCDDFGLRFSKCQDFSILGPIALAAHQGRFLGEALQRVTQYIHVYSPAILITLNDFPDQDRLFLGFEIQLKPVIPCRQAIELSVALSFQVLTMLSLGLSKPKGIYFPHKPLASNYAYRSNFPCPVSFQEGIAGIIIDKQDLLLPIEKLDDGLGVIAFEYLQSHFANDQQKVSQKVESLIRPMLMVRQCNNYAIAKTLNMHVRSLHRSLSQENTSFMLIKDRVLKELAVQYLGQNELKLGQIANLLGYSEQSAFSRSCYRWFSMGPRQYRKQSLQ